MQASPGGTTLLFTDIEGSTRLWEQEGARMPGALAGHDALARAAVESNAGTIVKTTGDGIYAAFGDPLDAINATLALQLALGDPSATNGIAFRVRCGLHLGVVEQRDGDLFGSPVNRAARIMSAAHGSQVLLSQAVVDQVRERLPPLVSLRDLGGVRLRDLAKSEHVYQLVYPGLREDFPALRSLEATPNNLPLQVTSFIGRERELAEIKSLLENTRLLTLLGMGGLGKTRLSLQVAADMLENNPDGVWFVDLAPIKDPTLVPNAAAQVLGVREEPGKTLTQTLCEHVKDHKLLLVIDNCEHLVSACASLANALLLGAPGVRMTRDQPRGAAYSRRANLSGPAARGAGPQGRRRSPASFGSGAAVRGAGATSEAELHADRTRRSGRCRNLRAARRHPACAGTRGRADALAVDRRDQYKAARPLQAAHRRQSRRARAAADAARARELVVRSAAGTRADAARPPERIRRRF